MNTTAKTILIWVLILVAAVGLYNFIEASGGRQVQTMNLTELLNRVERGEVADVEVSGSTVTGHLKGNNEPFRSTIPADYVAPYDKLITNGVRVTVVPPDTSEWIAGIPTVIVLVGSLVWLAISVLVLILVADLSRFVKRELARISGSQSLV